MKRRRGIDSSERLGRHRWKVERTLAWLTAYRMLTLRYERHGRCYATFVATITGSRKLQATT